MSNSNLIQPASSRLVTLLKAPFIAGLILLAGALISPAAIVVVHSEGTQFPLPTTPFTYNYTVQQADTVLVVATYRDAGGSAYTSLTFNGDPQSGALVGNRTSLFYYTNASVGTVTITGNNTASDSGIYVWELLGVDKTAGVVGVLGIEGDATGTQITTIADNSFVVDAIGWNPTSVAADTTVSLVPDGDNTTIDGTNFTYRINFGGGGLLAGGTGTAKGPAGTYNLGWTITQSQGGQGNLNELAFAFAPAPGAGGPSVTATANPASGFVGDSFTITATVTPGAGTVTNVTVDLSAVGGSSAAPLILQGANVYTNTFTVVSGAAGTVNLTVTATDNTPYSGTHKVAFEIFTSDRTWDGGSLVSDNFSDAANWVGDVAPTPAANNFIFAGTTRLTPDMNQSYGASGVTFDGSAGSFVLGSSGGHVLTLTGGIVNNSANPQTLNLSITNAGITTPFFGFNNIVVNGRISGAGGLTSDNSAAVILNGTNTFTGGMSINSGTLQIAGAGLLGGTNGIYAGRITNSGVLQYSSSATQTLSGVVSWFGTVVKDGPGKLILAANNTYFADTHISNGVLQVTGTLAADNANNYVYGIINNGTLQWSGAAAQTLSGVISGTGGLLKDGAGTLTLNGANTYSGTTVVNGGTLVYNPNTVTYPTINALTIGSNGTVRVNANNFSSLPVGNLTLNSDSILNLNYDFSGGNPTVASVAVSGSLSTPATNIIRISGFGAAIGQFPLISYTGTSPANLNNYVLGLPPGVTGTLINNTANKTIDLDVTASSPSTWITLIANDGFGASSFNSAGQWSDGNPPTPGNGYHTGPYLLRTPADTNSYTFAGSALSVDQYGFNTLVGRFILKGAGNATITIDNLILNGGLLDYANVNFDNGFRTIAGNILLNGGTTSYMGSIPGETLSIAAPISGTGHLQIGGANVNNGGDIGVVALSGDNTYSGNTTVATGTLLANGTAPNTPSVTVLTNATLGGTNSIGGIVTVQSGATLAPGILAQGSLTNTIGTLTAGGAVSVSGTVLVKIDRNASPNSDKLTAPSVTISAGATLTVTNLGATNFTAGDTFTLFSTPVTGAFSVTNLPALPSPNLAWVNDLAVNGTISVTNIGGSPSGPVLLTNSYSPGTGILSLSWPAGEGWRLQAQTNNLATGLGTNWVYVTDGSVNSTNITTGINNGTVFYRLVYP